MATWMSEYMSALDARDLREQAYVNHIRAYTKLADRAAALQTSAADPSNANQAIPLSSRGQTSPLRAQGKGQTAELPGELVSQLRADLTTTQRSRTELQESLKTVNEELEQLRVKAQKDTRRIDELFREKASLERRVRDRDEELKGKSRLVEDVHNEMVSLNLQLHMVEKRSQELELENKDLVDRWMARMGQEADAMNKASDWS